MKVSKDLLKRGLELTQGVNKDAFVRLVSESKNSFSIRYQGHDKGVSVLIAAEEMKEEFDILIKQNLIMDAIKRLPKADIQLVLQEGTLLVKCKQSRLKLPLETIIDPSTIAPKASIKSMEQPYICSMTGLQLKNFVKESRHILVPAGNKIMESLHFAVLSEDVSVSTYSNIGISWRGELKKDFEKKFMLLESTLSPLLSVIRDDETVRIYVGSEVEGVMVALDKAVVHFPAIHGKAPELQDLLNNHLVDTYAYVSTKELLEALHVCQAMSSKVLLAIKNNKLVVSSRGVGDCLSELDYSGENNIHELEFMAHNEYLKQVLTSLNINEDVKLIFPKDGSYIIAEQDLKYELLMGIREKRG